MVKTIIRGHIKNIKITDIHKLTFKYKGCNGFGRTIMIKGNKNLRPDYKYFYINHYYGKTVEEFVGKLKRGDMQFGNGKKNYLYQINKFFYINEITYEKIIFLEKKLGINLLKYKKKLKIKQNFTNF